MSKNSLIDSEGFFLFSFLRLAISSVDKPASKLVSYTVVSYTVVFFTVDGPGKAACAGGGDKAAGGGGGCGS